MTSTVVITGASGMLGTAVVSQFLQDTKDRIVAVRGERPLRVQDERIVDVSLDLTDKAQVRDRLGDVEPRCLVHCAAMTHLGRCEEDELQALAVNVGSLHHLLSLSGLRQSHVVYISSDAIYPDRPELKTEAMEPGPTSVYGMTKLWGEDAVRFMAERSLILRTTIVGPDVGQFFGWLVEHAIDRREVPLFRDVKFSPLSSHRLAQVISSAVSQELTGVFNAGSQDAVTKEEFGCRVLKRVNPECSWRSTSLSDLSSPVRRSFNMAMDSTKLSQALGPMPTVDETIEEVMRSRELPPRGHR